MTTLELVKDRIAAAEDYKNKLLREVTAANLRAGEVMNSLETLRTIRDALEKSEVKPAGKKHIPGVVVTNGHATCIICGEGYFESSNIDGCCKGVKP